MNHNGMGGMPNGGMGMMGMVPNGQMNPNMVRPGVHQGMPAQNGYQAMQQILLKQFHTMDKSSLPQGWQQPFNPTERVKHVTELVTMLRTINPQQDLNQVLHLARQLEEKLFRESPTKEIYTQNINARKQQLQQRRQANATNLGQGLQQSPHMMGPQQQQMFAQPGQGQVQMANGAPNHFGPRFNPQVPRQAQMSDAQQMASAQHLNGQMPGGMPNMHPGMGNMGQPPNVNQIQQQLSPQEQHQIQALAQQMMVKAPQDQIPMIRNNVLRSMSPAQRMQLGQTNADPASIWFKQRALTLFMQNKRAAQQGQPQPQLNPNMQFNQNMPHPNAPAGPGFDNPNNFDFFEKQRNAELAGRSGELVVPGNPMQRPGSNAGMRPGMPQMGNGFMNPNQPGAQNQPRPGQQPGHSGGLVSNGIHTTSGPGMASTPSMSHINQPFNSNVPSPSMPQNMTPSSSQPNGQQPPQMRMPTAREHAQLQMDLQHLPAHFREGLQQKPIQQQLAIVQQIKTKQKLADLQRNRGGIAGNMPGNMQMLQQPQQTPNHPSKAPGQPNQQQPLQPLNPEQERQMDEWAFPQHIVRKLISHLPDTIRTWAQVKNFASSEQMSPQIQQNIRKLQVLHHAQIPRNGPSQQGGARPPDQNTQNAQAVSNASAAASNVALQFLTDHQCNQVRLKNPGMSHLSNDDIRKKWTQVQMQKKMQQAKQTQQQTQPLPLPQPSQLQPSQLQQSVNNAGSKPNQPTSNQSSNKAQPQQTTQVSAQKAKPPTQSQPAKQPAKKDSNDDVVEVPNPNLQQKSKAAQPPQKNQSTHTGAPNSAPGQQPLPQKSASSLAAATINTETLSMYRQWRAEAQARLPTPQVANYTPHQRSSVDVVLMGSFKMLAQIDNVLMQYFQHNHDMSEDEKVAEIKSLLTTSLLVRKQFDTSGKEPKVADRLTMDYLSLASSLTKLKGVALKVAAMRNPRVQDQPGGGPPGGAAQLLDQQFKAPEAPMQPMNKVEPVRKPSTKRPAKDQPPPAPTDEKQSPFSFQSGGGVPKYADAQPFNRELQLPPHKRRKGPGGSSTPVPSPPTDSPKVNKSPKAKPAEKPLKCKQEGCPNSKAVFATKEDLQKHLDTAHQEKMPSDPLEYALGHMRQAWNLDEEGKSKNPAVRMEKSASKQSPTSQTKSLGPGGVPMNRAVTSGNSNAPRTPQSMSTAGSSSKPATPAMQAGKLPGKTQPPPTPPQDLWAGCPITAQSLAEILPAPVPSSSLASLTPDSKTSPDANDKPADKGTASPKTPKANDLLNLDNIQVKDISTADVKADGMDFDFDFGGGMGPYENGMFGTADALSGGAFGGGLEELFGGDIALSGNTSWDDMTMYDAKPTAVAPKDSNSRGLSGTKTPIPGKAKQQESDDTWAAAFEMAWED